MKKNKKLMILIGAAVLVAAAAVVVVLVLFMPKAKRTGNVTYHYQDAVFLECLDNDPKYGTATQGLASSEKYLYSAKHKDNKYAIIYQYDVKKDTQKLMTYYPSLDSSEAGPIDCVDHCNDMTFYTDADKKDYLITASAYHPNSSGNPSPCLTRLQVDEKAATLRFTGYFNLLRKNSSGQYKYFSASSVRHVAQTEEYHYLLVKNANDFYLAKLPAGAAGGSLENPQEIRCVKVFTIENRNALFADQNGELYTVDNLESWTNQGSFYDVEEDLLYVPLYNQFNAPTTRYDNVITVFDVNGLLTVEALDALTEDQTVMLHPTNLSFHLTNDRQRIFEIESCVFLKNQGKFGDHSFYFNADGNPVSDYEGIWKVNYERGDVEVKSLVDENSIIYTVEYNYNYNNLPESEWPESTSSGNYSMKRDTIHIVGITTNLRMNRFTSTGGQFTGWNLLRHSDNCWLYSDGNWYAESGAPAGLEKKLLGDAEPVDNLTAVNGDLITAYAQWK